MSLNTNPTRLKKIDMFNSEIGTVIRGELMELVHDARYSTQEAHTIDTSTYPEGRIPFVDKHLLYLSKNPNVNPTHYLANLRLKIKVR